ncbi:protease inhibitor I9 family protein [Rossellomorea sp. NPDC077527]|uniref:protease inhibitor I9 family protein n=1 Tax=Rossellomorea sp. NPDC077527 TaxID=3364510 RepID=UPI0037C7B493
MKKWYCRALFVLSLIFVSGCMNEGDMGEKIETQVVEETMNSSIKVDPELDLSSGETISTIIEFKTKPAKVAVLEAKAQGVELTLESAKEEVEKSHREFEKELYLFLEKNEVEYHILHRYKTAFNGVSMELPANEIKRLMGSAVISKIYRNKELQLEPPIQPSNRME